jgi:hypothetical protein
MARPARWIAGIAVMAVLAGPAYAQEEKKASPLPSHLPLATEACFGRVYDAAHLASHPKQRVASFHLAREFKGDPNAEAEPSPEQEMKDVDGEYGRVLVNAYVRFRDRKGIYANGLSCGKSDGKVSCSIDCDGGSFDLKASGQSLLLENHGFVVVGGCGASEDEQERTEIVSPGADDKVFRLDPKPFAACMAERAALAPAFARLGKPLRVRFEEADTLCLSRSYDAAHLTAHPKQAVKRIAVLKSKESKADPGDQFYTLTFRVETRDGKTFAGKTDCAADNYAYACQPKVPMDADRYFYLTRSANDDVILRDQHALLGKLFNARLGSDDRAFRLKTAPAGACRF